MSEPGTESLQVLIVDDEPAGQHWVAIHVLESWPFTAPPALHYATSVRQAVSRTMQEHYALVLLDWHLGTETGSQLLHYLRERGSRVPVVVVTGVEQQQLEVDLTRWGAAYLSKEGLNAASFHRAIAHALALISTMPQAGAEGALALPQSSLPLLDVGSLVPGR